MPNPTNGWTSPALPSVTRSMCMRSILGQTAPIREGWHNAKDGHGIRIARKSMFRPNWPMYLLAQMHDYSSIISDLKLRHGIRVHRWRKTMSAAAWGVYTLDGRTINWIESPYPKTPISLAIFLHEIGHHVIGFDTYKRRCEEEYHAWVW